VATVAKGARRPKSPFAGKLDIFYEAEFSFSRSQRSELHNLREVKLQDTHAAIRTDLGKLQQAAYAAAFLEQATETETPLPEVYRLVGGFLEWLCAHEPQLPGIFALELKLLYILGLEPEMVGTRLTPGGKKIVTALLEGDWSTSVRLQLSAAQSQEIGQWLHDFLILHLGRLPRGRATALISGR
jgi:DNA repair protein RecO (recombination protein O)